jgi:Protein of unknown function (DUF2530)
MKNAVLTIWLGIVVWAIALVVEIARNAKATAIWTCLFGIALGFIGLRYTIRRAKREFWN